MVSWGRPIQCCQEWTLARYHVSQVHRHRQKPQNVNVYGCLREAGWPFAMRRETQNQDPWQLESCKWEVTTTIRTFFCTQPQTRCTNICTNNLIQPFCQNKPSYAAQGDSAKSKITRKIPAAAVTRSSMMRRQATLHTFPGCSHQRGSVASWWSATNPETL